MRMPTVLSCARPFRNFFRIASGADPGSAPVLLLLLVLWAAMGAAGVTAAAPLGPSPAPAPARSAGDEDADDDRGTRACPWRLTGWFPST